MVDWRLDEYRSGLIARWGRVRGTGGVRPQYRIRLLFGAVNEVNWKMANCIMHPGRSPTLGLMLGICEHVTWRIYWCVCYSGALKSDVPCVWKRMELHIGSLSAVPSIL